MQKNLVTSVDKDFIFTARVSKKNMEIIMSKTTTQFDKIIKDTADFNTQYSDACSKSCAIMMKGFEDILGTVMSLSQSSAEKQAKLVKEAMSSKTVNEFAEVQNKIAQENFDDLMSGATKISEISVKLLTDSSEPVSAEINKVVQKATKSMAA